MTDEHLIEAAERTAENDRKGLCTKIHDALSEHGEPDCIDCGTAIDAKRREALPSAKRCIGCQHNFETRGSRGF